jgi:septum formation protein
VVSVDGHTLGKPADPRDAAAMLTRLSGRDHSVITALAIAAPDGRTALGSAISRVRFHRLGLPEIEAYLASGEHRDKAGAYAIQGAAAAFASLARGHRDTVVGLPGHLLGRLLGEMGHPAASRVSESARVRGSANLHRP